MANPNFPENRDPKPPFEDPRTTNTGLYVGLGVAALIILALSAWTGSNDVPNQNAAQTQTEQAPATKTQ